MLYPEDAAARELFARVGGVVVPDHEQALNAFSAATATFAAHLDHLSTIAGRLADQGVDHDAWPPRRAAPHDLRHDVVRRALDRVPARVRG